jgi:hypothetical protein
LQVPEFRTPVPPKKEKKRKEKRPRVHSIESYNLDLLYFAFPVLFLGTINFYLQIKTCKFACLGGPHL